MVFFDIGRHCLGAIQMVVTLIGYRGCGKTTVAALLARKVDWEHVDADEEVERSSGRTIRQLFDESGEAGFRRWERQVISELLSRDRYVISAGGGAVLNEQTRADMRAAGPVVWLTASVETLRQRIEQDTATAEQRPALTAAGVRDEIEQLLSQRTPLYRECATLMVDTDGRTKDEIVEQIFNELGGELSGGHPSA